MRDRLAARGIDAEASCEALLAEVRKDVPPRLLAALGAPEGKQPYRLPWNHRAKRDA